MKRKDIIKALEGGNVVMVTNPRVGIQERKQFTLLKCGKAITSRQFHSLRDMLRGVGDGLFGDSQTYELRP